MRSYQSQVLPPSKRRLELVSTLSRAGYHTAVVGKNHFGLSSDRTRAEAHGYSELHLHEGLLMYDSYSPQFVQHDDYGAWFNRTCPGCDALAERRMTRGDSTIAAPWRQTPGGTPYNSIKGFEYPYPETWHPTAWTADQAILSFERWLRRRQAYTDTRPLFLKVSFHRPHQPYDPPERWLRYMLDRWDRIEPPATGAWDAHYADALNCTAARKEFCGAACGYLSHCGRLQNSEARLVRAHYYASLAFVDEQAGRVLARMRSSDEWRQTFVLYVSDHGDALGDHSLWRKGWPYEQVASVPFYIRWPESMDSIIQLPRGTVLRGPLVELRDVFPTLAEVAGVDLRVHPADESPDGLSLLPLLRGDISTRQWRSLLVLELAMCNFEGVGANWVAVTDGRTKYIRHLSTGREQLFNLTGDRYEQFDLAYQGNTVLAPWRDRLAAEFIREGRGPKWVSTEGSLPLAGSCEDYELLEAYDEYSPG